MCTQPCFKFILFYTFVGNVAAYSKLMTHLDIIQASSIPVPASAKEFTMCKFPKNLIFILFFSFSAHTHTPSHSTRQLGRIIIGIADIARYNSECSGEWRNGAACMRPRYRRRGSVRRQMV